MAFHWLCRKKPKLCNIPDVSPDNSQTEGQNILKTEVFVIKTELLMTNCVFFYFCTISQEDVQTEDV
jgi:hypothetical protein